MTDEQIIKALECCSSNATGNEYCKDCPYNIYEYCGEESAKDTLNLIKRQKAEIKHLEAENKLLIDRNCELAEKGEKAIITFVKSQNETKAKAIKEFAEKLKEKAYEIHGFYDVVDVSDIDNLVKEMTEEQSEQRNT